MYYGSGQNELCRSSCEVRWPSCNVNVILSSLLKIRHIKQYWVTYSGRPFKFSSKYVKKLFILSHKSYLIEHGKYIEEINNLEVSYSFQLWIPFKDFMFSRNGIINTELLLVFENYCAATTWNEWVS